MTASMNQEQFLEVIDRDEADRRFRAPLDLSPLEAEVIPLAQALGRILAEDVVAELDVPSFDRSNVDGFAVQAGDTFGASEDTPRTLNLNAEVLSTGIEPRENVRPDSATSIATGAMLPRGADAVIMIEYTDVRQGKVMLTRPVAPGANISFAGTDIGRGEIVLRQGDRLTARETGVLAALGLDSVSVIRRPRVAILSTGDELLWPGTPMRPGMVHDSNSTVLADTVRELGGDPTILGIVPDEDAALDAALENGRDHDMVLLSGGTSKGAGDLSYRAVARMGKPGIVAHGVALKPGKPLCLAVINREGTRPLPVAVLPGFPTSAIFTFHEFLAPVMRELAGQRSTVRQLVQARLPLRVNSERGRTEYLLVGLVANVEGTSPSWIAYPMGKGSGSVTAFSRADGFLIIPRQREYIERDTVVDVHLLASDLRPADLVVIGSHCTGLDALLGLIHRRGYSCKIMAVGSTGGLEAAKRGECDIAGVHLFDEMTNTYNRPFLTPEMELIRGYRRVQGIVFRRGDSRFEGHSLETALANALADPECVMVNRNRGSGTRVLIDRLLGKARPLGYLAEPRSHNAVVTAVQQGRADWGVAIEPAANAVSLGFIAMQDEEYDFVIPRSRRDRPAVQVFIEILQSDEGRSVLRQQGFGEALQIAD